MIHWQEQTITKPRVHNHARKTDVSNSWFPDSF